MFTAIIAILFYMLKKAKDENKNIKNDMGRVLNLREAALDISNRVVNLDPTNDLFDYILKSCISLIPKSDYGSILMFNEDKLLVAHASVGFNKDEISKMRLRVEDSFVYVATGGNVKKTTIINGLEQIVLAENTIKSGDKGFVIRSEVSAPLIINEEFVGLLCVDGDEENIFTDEDVSVLDYMARQISAVIKNQNLYRDILYLSRYDSLTMMLNRSSFDSIVSELIEMSKKKLVFVILDLDKLKKINDTYGHLIGDELIKTFSLELSKCFIGDDMCARYGGDEFVALSQERTESEVEELMIYLASNLKAGGVEKNGVYIYPKFSYGISTTSESLVTLDDLYRSADDKMYIQKRSKGSRRSTKEFGNKID